MTTATIRASVLPRFADCHRRGYGAIYGMQRTARGTIANGEPASIPVPTMFGTVCHAMVAEGIAGNTEDTNLAAQAERHWHKVTAEKRIGWDKLTPSRAVAVFQTQQAVRALINVYNDMDEQPQATEKFMTMPASAITAESEHDNIMLSGTADIITWSRKTHEFRIIDWKTGKNLSLYPPQLCLYAHLLKHNAQASQPVNVSHVWIKRGEDKAARYDYSISDHRDTLLKILLSIIDGHGGFADNRDDDAVRSHILSAIPNPDSRVCGQKYCALFATPYCPEGAAAKGITTTPQQETIQ